MKRRPAGMDWCDLTGQVMWVTGAGKGIGAGIARLAAAHGAEVWLTSRTAADVEALAAELRKSGGDAHAAPADVTNPEQIQAVCDRISERCGRLDVLVCSAGIGIYGPLSAAAPADLDQQLAVNVGGTLTCCQAALTLMRPAKRGAIIGIASIMSVTGYRQQGTYAASKHAMLGLLKVLGKEEQAHGIRVSAICPGGVDTELVRASRPDLDSTTLMTVDDVAQAVLYLLSLSERCAVDVLQLRRRGAEPFA